MKYFSHFFLALLFIACSGKQVDPKMIAVTIEPQRYFAEKIAGDKFTIHCVVPSGQNPEAYDPTPKQMIEVSQSLAYLQIGYLGFEQVWMKTIQENNPDMQLFDLSEGVTLLQSPEQEDLEHEHEADHHHHAGGVDPHIWSSIGGAKTIAWNTLHALITLDKEHTSYYWENYNRLMAEIEQTEAVIKELLQPLTHRTFIIYHPALTYFAREFDLTQLCIEMDGKEPSPLQLKQLVEAAREHHARVVFIQQEFDQKNAELIVRETGCRLVRIHPLSYNWSEELIRIAQALSEKTSGEK